jgi:hypothetical protein
MLQSTFLWSFNHFIINSFYLVVISFCLVHGRGAITCTRIMPVDKCFVNVKPIRIHINHALLQINREPERKLSSERKKQRGNIEGKEKQTLPTGKLTQPTTTQNAHCFSSNQTVPAMSAQY